jgi:hypothetical protein
VTAEAELKNVQAALNKQINKIDKQAIHPIDWNIKCV